MNSFFDKETVQKTVHRFKLKRKARFILWTIAIVICLITFVLACYVMTTIPFNSVANTAPGSAIRKVRENANCGYVFGILWILFYFAALFMFFSMKFSKGKLYKKRHFALQGLLTFLSVLFMLISWACYASAYDVASTVAYAVFGFFNIFALGGTMHLFIRHHFFKKNIVVQIQKQDEVKDKEE